MSASPNPPTPPHPPSGKRKRSASGWATRKARDARRPAEYYEGKQALESPSYTLGVLDDLQLQVYLTFPMQEKYAATSFERFKGWLVRRLHTKWQTAVVVRVDRDKPSGHHWASDLWRLQLGGTSTIFATTQQRFVLRGKAHVIREVSAQLFSDTTAHASLANPAEAHLAPP